MKHFFECQPQIVKHISRKVKDQGAREDLLQEIFIKFAIGFGRMKHQDNLCGYLYRITSTTITDYYRQENRFVAAVDEAVFEKAAPHLAINNQYHLADRYLRAIVEGLPHKYSEALRLIDLEGKPQKEVAKTLGLSYTGMKSRVQRGREMLKKAVLDCCDYEFDRYGNVVGCCNGKKT